MRHSCLLPTAALASVLLLSCNEPVGVTDSMQAATPSLKAQVDRFETPLVISFAQESPPIAALVGVSLENFTAFCAGAEPEAVADAMIVTHPTKQGGTSEVLLTRGRRISALVWPVDVGPGGSPCDFPDVQPFVGTVNATIVDNEGQFFETAPGGNAFLIRFVGTVTDTETGQRYHLQGALHIVVLPDGTFTFQPARFLSLTPIGG
jgi:hypothetical protein